jgi:peroxiredoxin
VPAGSTADVIEKFKRAYENDGIFETKVSSTGSNSYHVELTVDTEERVFGALSTTSAMIVRNAFVEGAKVDMVELFMKTTTGGAAGRFQMSRADAEALLNKKMKREDYFITKVIY